MRLVLSLALVIVMLVVVVPRIDGIHETRQSPAADRPSPGSARDPDISPAEIPRAAFYRWRAPDGGLHITSDPPREARQVEVFHYRQAASGPAPGAAGSANPSGPASPADRLLDDPGLDNILDEVARIMGRLEARARALEALKGQL